MHASAFAVAVVVVRVRVPQDCLTVHADILLLLGLSFMNISNPWCLFSTCDTQL